MLFLIDFFVLAADPDITCINVEWFKVLVDGDAVADLQVIVFDNEVAPLQIIIGVVKHNIVSKLRNHFLQNKEHFFFVSGKTSLSCFRVHQIHLIQFLFYFVVVTPKHNHKRNFTICSSDLKNAVVMLADSEVQTYQNDI